MRLIANNTQGPATIPAPQALVGTPGFANSGVPGAFAETTSDPDQYNVMMQELVNLSTLLGASLNVDNAQAARVVLQAASANVTAISSTPGGPLTIAELGLILINATAGNISLTLPLAAAGNGVPLRFAFLRTDTSGHTVTVALSGGDTALLYTSPLSIPVGAVVPVMSDGVSHWILTSVDGSVAAETARAEAAEALLVPFSHLIAPATVYSAGGVSLGASYSDTISITFTPTCNGVIKASGSINFNTTASALVTEKLFINGTQVDGDTVEPGASHAGVLAVTAGTPCTIAYQVSTGGTSPGVTATYRVSLDNFEPTS